MKSEGIRQFGILAIPNELFAQPDAPSTSDVKVVLRKFGGEPPGTTEKGEAGKELARAVGKLINAGEGEAAAKIIFAAMGRTLPESL